MLMRMLRKVRYLSSPSKKLNIRSNRPKNLQGEFKCDLHYLVMFRGRLNGCNQELRTIESAFRN